MRRISLLRDGLLLRLRLLALLPICLLAALFALLRLLYCIVVNPARGWVITVAHDQLANAAANGDPDETISSRAYRAQVERRRWGCVLCRFLDLFQKNHCALSAGT
jgi:hypothetical protein